MIGLDTNILIRYIVQDEPLQSRKAVKFIEQECSDESSVFINAIILCELVWVLESGYEYSREEISIVLEKILRTRQFYIADTHILWQALSDYQHKGVDFSDSYIAHYNIHSGCKTTITFDKKASRLAQMKLLT